MRNVAYENSVTALSELGPMRVWSLLVTVFGDLAQERALDGPTLSAIMAEIGIKPEATRVALHRLRSDGWITSEKSGRTSLYSLTETGQRDSAAARPRIYGKPDHMGRAAQMILLADASATLDPSDYAQVAPRLFIAGADAAMPDYAMQLQPMDIPPWLGPQIETATMRDSYLALHAVLQDIQGALPDAAVLAPLHVAVLRVLIVHAWRRLALKHPDLPRGAHSPDWRGHDCRALVTRLLDRFDRPTLDAIKAA
jgi:phenylacetic acid degradation operon negative regulatory protein